MQERFYRPIRRWCEAHGKIYTGHLNHTAALERMGLQLLWLLLLLGAGRLLVNHAQKRVTVQGG